MNPLGYIRYLRFFLLGGSGYRNIDSSIFASYVNNAIVVLRLGIVLRDQRTLAPLPVRHEAVQSVGKIHSTILGRCPVFLNHYSAIPFVVV
jgi:hypothetical protein